MPAFYLTKGIEKGDVMHRQAQAGAPCDTKNTMKNTLCLLLSALWLFPLAAQSQAPQQMVRMNVGSVQGVAPGYKATAGSGLTLNIAAGTAFCSGAIQSYAGGTLTMTPSATNYVYLDPSANCAPATNTSGFTGGAIPIATVVTGSSAVTAVTDDRTMFTTTSGGSGTGTCAANQFVTAVNSGSPTCAQPAFSNLTGAAAPAQLPSATAGAQGAIQLGGDLSGTSSAPKVTGIQGIPVSSTAPSNGQVHQYNSGSNQWVPATLPTGTVTSVGLSTPNWLSVSGSPVTASGTLAVTAASGQAANQFLATPNGASGAVSLRAISPADLPPASSTAEGILQLTADLGGTAAAPKVAGLQGNPVAGTAPTANQVLQWSGTAWSPASLPASVVAGSCSANQFVTALYAGSAPACASALTASTASTNQFATGISAAGALSYAQPAFSNLSGTATAAQLPSATSSAQGAVQLAGDFAGTSSAPKVTGLQGIPVSSTAPTNGQVHQYNSGSNQWVPATLPSGTVTSVGLSVPAWLSVAGSPITASGTLAVTAASGQTANQFLATPNGASGALSVRAIAPADLPAAGSTAEGILELAGDLGGSASAPKVAGLQGIAISSTAPASGQCLTYSGSNWAPGSCGSGGGTPGGSSSQVQFNSSGAFGGSANLTWVSPKLTIGAASSATGQLALAGTTSGVVTVQPQAAAGTYNFNLPTTAGTSGQPLLSGGGGSAAMTFATLGVAAGGTGIASGTSGGVPCFTAAATIASSAALTSGQLVTGGGAGACPSVGNLSGDVSTSGSTATTISKIQGNAVSLTSLNAGDLFYWNGTQWTNGKPGMTVNLQSGTSYTVQGASSSSSGDLAKLISFSNSSAVAVTLPQCGSTGFGNGFVIYVHNRGSGTVTVTPTTSTVDGAASLALTQGQKAAITCNTGDGNYYSF